MPAAPDLPAVLDGMDALYRRRRESLAQWDLWQDVWTGQYPKVMAVLRAASNGDERELSRAMDALGRTKL
jgi:hypothetical protein